MAVGDAQADPSGQAFSGWTASSGQSGARRFRNVAVSNVPLSIKTAAGSILAYLFRNPNTSPVYVNFYGNPSSEVIVGDTVRGVPVSRVMVPAAIDSSNPGQLIVTPGTFPVTWGNAGLTVAAITTDSDTGKTAPSSAIYAEIQYV